MKLRNDLSTKLEALTKASTAVSSAGSSISGLSRTDVQKNMYSSLKNKSIDGKKSNSLKTKYGIESSDKLDFLNEKTQYTATADGRLQLTDGTYLDDWDFITLKFQSRATGKAVNFRATVSGISETVSPSWDSGKFIGSPFNYYTYSSIERSVSFNFKVYSTTPAQHVAAWQRINFLTGLAYPQGYNQPYATPPFVLLTLGNLYVNKNAYIESLSYTMDDNAGWEIGLNDESVKTYKCPIVVDVAITLKFVESRNTTSGGKFYGFELGREATAEVPSSANAQLTNDANATAGLLTTQQKDTKVDINEKKNLNKKKQTQKSSVKANTNVKNQLKK